MQTRIYTCQAGRERLRLVFSEKDLVSNMKNYGLKWGSNPCYSLFYYWNYRGLFGMHQSVFPDWLHTVLKGMVEKVLSWVLIILHVFKNVIVKKYSTNRHLCAPWKDNMSTLDYRIQHFPTHVMCFDMFRSVRFPTGLSYLLKQETKSSKSNSGRKTTGLLTGNIPAWKLLPALFQLMFCVGHDGSLLPNWSRKLNQIFPGISDGCIQDVSEVVNSAMSAVMEFCFVVSCKTMRKSSVECMKYLCSVAQYHVLRLGMLMRIVSQYSKTARRYTMPLWNQVNPGNKKHYWMHLCEAKVELGPHLRLWDTELAEGSWKTVMKVPHHMSSKKDSEKKQQMVNYMRDIVAISELEHSIQDRFDRSKSGTSRRRSCKGGVNEFTVHHSYDVDALKFDSSRRRWIRADEKGDFESRYLHAVVDMDCLNSFLLPITEG